MDALPNDSAAPQGTTAGTEARSSYQLIVFRLGGQEYALVIDQIKEVVITPKVSRIPLTPLYIRGVANIRGNILTIIDLEERFGLANPEDAVTDGTPHYTLVLASETCKMGILVKEVPGTLSVKEGDVDLSPGVLGEVVSGQGCIRGIVRSGGRLILLLDALKVVTGEHLAQTLATPLA